MACQLAARETRYLLQVQLQLSGVPRPHFKHVNSIWIDSSYDVVHRVQLYFCLSCHSNLERKKGEAHEMMPSHKHPSIRRSYLLLGYLTGMIRLLRFACVKFCFNVGGFFRAPLQFLTSKGTTTCICLKQQLYPFLHATKSRFTVRSMIFSGNQSKRPVQQKFVILNLHCYTIFFECGEPSCAIRCFLLFSKHLIGFRGEAVLAACLAARSKTFSRCGTTHSASEGREAISMAELDMGCGWM